MPEKFEIEVPISVKGGIGEIGKQTGDKIAGQVAQMSKGIKGLATKFGALGVALTAAVGILAKSSPYLKGILSIFGRAFMIFFRPFGDFLATLLRPLAILLMKIAVAFLKWTRPITGAVREAVAAAPQIPMTGITLVDMALEIVNWAFKIGVALGTVILEIGKGAFELGVKIGEWLLDYVILPAGEWIADKLFGIWDWTKDFAGWLWNQITTIWTWVFDFGGWIWDQITSIWSWTYDFGAWVWGKITDIFKNIKEFFFGGGGQVGIPSVPRDGMYYLHKGEEVVTRTSAGQGRSVVYRPTFQITGNISRDIDMDAIVRRASRMTETDLKQRGVI